MTTESATSGVTDEAPSPRPRRWPTVLLALLGAVLLVFGVAHVLLGRYEPDVALVAQDLQAPAAVQPLRVAGRDITQVQYVDREEMRIALTLDNRGRLPLTVTDASPDGPRARRLLHAFAVTGLRDGDEFAPGAPTTGDQVTIGGGDSDVVVVRVRFTDCEFISSRSSSVLSHVRLRYRVLWRSGELTVPLQTTYRAASPRDLQCPRSTLETRPPG